MLKKTAKCCNHLWSTILFLVWQKQSLGLYLNHQKKIFRYKVLPLDLSVKEIMDTWTLQTGYPVITAIRSYDNHKVTVSQVVHIYSLTLHLLGYNPFLPSSCHRSSISQVPQPTEFVLAIARSSAVTISVSFSLCICLPFLPTSETAASPWADFSFFSFPTFSPSYPLTDYYSPTKTHRFHPSPTTPLCCSVASQRPMQPPRCTHYCILAFILLYAQRKLPNYMGYLNGCVNTVVAKKEYFFKVQI